MGIQNIQSVLGDLELFSWDGNETVVAIWRIDIFPNLEVVTGQVALIFGVPKVVLQPGGGLGSLRAVGQLFIANNAAGGGLQNTFLEFLSRLECVGTGASFNGLTNLKSLYGLGRLVDAMPNSETSYCVLQLGDFPTNLTDVSALATFARCGRSNQRPDESPDSPTYARPCITVSCGSLLATWSDLCTYISRRTCS